MAVLDVDAHHGNGAQAIFSDREDVLTASAHVDPGAGWFPHFLGFADERGTANLNVPVAPGSGDDTWIDSVSQLARAAQEHGSDALVVALGVDAAGGDPNAPLAVTEDAFARRDVESGHWGYRRSSCRRGATCSRRSAPSCARASRVSRKVDPAEPEPVLDARLDQDRLSAGHRGDAPVGATHHGRRRPHTGVGSGHRPRVRDVRPLGHRVVPAHRARRLRRGLGDFFPLYPALLALLGSSLVWGTLLSLVAAGLGAVCVFRIAQAKLGDDGAHDTILILALFPTAFVFTAVYSDGLFLLLSAASFLAAERGRPWLAGVAGGLAVATRSLGLALLPALVYLLWPRSRRETWRLVPLLLLPAALGLYALYLDREVGDAFAFTNAQASGWDREFATLGPLGGLWMAIQAGGHGTLEILRDLPRAGEGSPGYSQALQVSFWNAAHLLLLVPLAWLTWVAWRRLGPALGLYALTTLIVILSVPSEGFPMVSMPRFVLTDFPVLIALAAVIQGRPRLRTGMLVGLGALSAGAGIAFSRGGVDRMRLERAVLLYDAGSGSAAGPRGSSSGPTGESSSPSFR